MKKLLSTLTAFAVAAAVVSGCSLSGDGKSKEVENVKKVPVSQIWDGYEELQGKDYGVIKMPDKIERPQEDKYYAVEVTPQSGDIGTAAPRFFKAFFKDKYNESKCEADGMGGMTYNDPQVGYSAFSVAPYNKSYVYPAPTTIFDTVGGGYDTIARYYVGEDDDKVLDLAGGSCTVGDIVDAAYGFMEEALYPLYNAPDIPMKPERVEYMQSMVDPDRRIAKMWCVYYYKGLSLAAGDSGEFEKTIFAGYEVEKYYAGYYVSMTFEGKDQMTDFYPICMPFDATGEELDELVSLSQAVELLCGELAENTRYEFDKVYLSYCAKTIVPSSYGADSEYDSAAMETINEALDPMDTKFVPNWCFEWLGYDANGAQRCYIKVNAVTGEITIDAKPNVSKPLEKPSEEENVEPKVIEVEILGYENDQLTYRYEGETVTAKMFPELFDKSGAGADYQRLAKQIIDNRFGIPVKGTIGFRKDGGISWCSVITNNGSHFKSYDYSTQSWLEANNYETDEELPNTEHLVDMKRISGSVYEFKNKYCSFTADLNDLKFIHKGDFPDHIEGVRFDGYRFESGEIIPESIMILDHIEEQIEVVNGKEEIFNNYIYRQPPVNYDNITFFGIVQSLSDDRAVVLLNDGKTTCDVPTFFNDGELREGMNVAVALSAGKELFGSGKQYKSEYAVFLTHPEEFIGNYDKLVHTDIAYAEFGNSLLRLICTMVDDVGR